MLFHCLHSTSLTLYHIVANANIVSFYKALVTSKVKTSSIIILNSDRW